MSAPIPRPQRARLSLVKLIHTPGIGAISVQAALERVFPRVVAEYRDDGFFQFQIRCGDITGRTRLVIRFGWSNRRDVSGVRRDRWVFEAMPGDPR